MRKATSIFYEMECLTEKSEKYLKFKYLMQDIRECHKTLSIFLKNNEKSFKFLGISWRLDGFDKFGSIHFESSQYIGSIPIMSHLNIQVGDFSVKPRFLNGQKFEEYAEILDLLGDSINSEFLDSPPLKSNTLKAPLYLECIKLITTLEELLRTSWRMFDNIKKIEKHPSGQVDWYQYAINQGKLEKTLLFPIRKNILIEHHNQLAQIKYAYELSKNEIFSSATPLRVRDRFKTRIKVIDKKLNGLQSVVTKKILQKISDKLVVKNCKTQANKILGHFTSEGIAWRVDFNVVFEKFVQHIISETVRQLGGSIFENQKFHSVGKKRVGLGHLEPDVVFEKNGFLFFVDAKYKAHFFNKGNMSHKLKDEFRRDQHQVMAYSSFSSTPAKASILCYPNKNASFEMTEYFNPINGNRNCFFILGIPLALSQIEASKSKFIELINYALDRFQTSWDSSLMRKIAEYPLIYKF